MPIHPFNNLTPKIHPSVYIAPSADVCGDVEIGQDSSVLFGAVVRGDITPITIGPLTNIQDNCVLHVTHNGKGTHLGQGISLGHGVILHDCTIKDWSLIGMNAVVLDRAVVGPGSMVGAGALVTPKTIIPPGWLALGSPAKPVRELTKAEQEGIRRTAERYRRVAETYRTGEPYAGEPE